MGMGDQKSKTAHFAAVFAFILAVPVIGIGYLISIMLFDLFFVSNARQYTNYLNGIVERAISLEQTGSLGVPRHNRLTHIELYPPDYVHANEILMKYYLSGRKIDCTLPIKIRILDYTDFDQVFGVLTSRFPRRYYVVFPFDVPDIRPFLKAASNSELLAPITYFDQLKVEFNRNGVIINGTDLSSAKKFPSVNWRATTCAGYNFIEFWG
jgi:hypothetical protein